MGTRGAVTTRLTQRESVSPNAEPATTVIFLRLHHEGGEVRSAWTAPMPPPRRVRFTNGNGEVGDRLREDGMRNGWLRPLW